MAEQKPQNHTHYGYRLSYTTRERLVGVFVLIAIALLFFALLFNHQTANFFASKFTLRAYLHNAQGISVGTPVTASGLFVGNVSAISIAPDNRIAISMRILDKYHTLIREDSRAKVSKLSLLGNAAIDIGAGSPDKPVMPDGATLPLQEPLPLDQIMAQVASGLEGARNTLARIDVISQQIDPRAVGQVVNNLTTASANLKSISTRIASGQGAAGKLLYDKQTEANIAKTVRALAGTLQDTRASLQTIQPLLHHASSASADLPALVDQARKLVTQLNTSMGTVNYQLQALPDLVTRTRQILDNASQTLQAIQNTWPVSRSVPKPITRERTPIHPPNG